MKSGHVALWIVAIAGIAVAPAVAKPFVPAGDDVVVERLPEQTDPTLKELKRMRAAISTLRLASPAAPSRRRVPPATLVSSARPKQH